MNGYSPTTKRLIREGLKNTSRPALTTDAQIMVERLEAAAQPGGAIGGHRVRVLLEAAQFIRKRLLAQEERAA
jgi:hypothetical protein